MSDTPKDQETGLLNTFASQMGDVPLLNRPKNGTTSLTGYRTPELAAEARAYVESLTSIPDNNPYKLNEGWDGQGTSPADKLRRGLLELMTEFYLDNIYPEWVGDALDDAYATLDMINVVGAVKENGWEIVYEFINSDDCPPYFQLPLKVQELFPFKKDDDDD